MRELPTIPDLRIHLTTPMAIVHLLRAGARNRLVTTDGTRLVAKLARIRKARWLGNSDNLNSRREPPQKTDAGLEPKAPIHDEFAGQNDQYEKEETEAGRQEEHWQVHVRAPDSEIIGREWPTETSLEWARLLPRLVRGLGRG